MQYTLTVSLATLRAARTHSAVKDVRYYLCGVYLDTKAGKVVATDGHRMLVAHARGVKVDAAPVIIPNELLDAALKQFGGEYARGKSLGAVPVTVTVDGAQLTIQTPTGQVSGKALDGQFPEWRRVVPQGEPAVLEHAPAVYQWPFITDACEAITLARNVVKSKAGQHAIRVYQRGEFPAIVCDAIADVVVIIMPMRHDVPADAAVTALRMAHDDALPYSDETRERVALEAAAAVSAAA
jgi:hypothetical protein